MNYNTLKELSKQSGVSMATLRRWCSEGKIEGAILAANAWFVPKGATLPTIQPAGKRAPAYGKRKHMGA